MSEQKPDMDSDVEQYSINSNTDPKNMQELTLYVSIDKSPVFARSNQIINNKNTRQVQNLLQNVQDKFQSMSEQIITRIDDMGNRIDDLEKNIGDLMTQAGIEGPENLK